jgi:hypothetical protein
MDTVDVPTLHDFEITGYRVDGSAQRLQFSLVTPKGTAKRGTGELTFSGVQGYLLENDPGMNIVFAVERVALPAFIEEKAERFIVSANCGWPLFWRGSVQDTIAWLTAKECHPWELSTSYGLMGWVVAKEATYRDACA